MVLKEILSTIAFIIYVNQKLVEFEQIVSLRIFDISLEIIAAGKKELHVVSLLFFFFFV